MSSFDSWSYEGKIWKYYEEWGLLLAIVVVLDPRFKMDVIECYYDLIYDIDASKHVERVWYAFISLYKEYEEDSSNCDDSYEDVGSSSSTNLVGSGSKIDGSGNRFDRFERWYTQSRSSTIRAYHKSEVEHYLEESVFLRIKNFNILGWWKINRAKLPIL